MANQTPLRMLSAVAFVDYVHIKHQVEKLDHDKVTQAVGQHDKDKVEYGEAYEVLEEYLAVARELIIILTCSSDIFLPKVATPT